MLAVAFNPTIYYFDTIFFYITSFTYLLVKIFGIRNKPETLLNKLTEILTYD